MANPSNNRLKYSLIAIGVVIVIFFVIIVAKSPTTTVNTTGDTPAPTSLVNAISSIKSSVLDQIGIGTADVLPKPISGQPLISNNKPEILYEGAEYCPYCATERWAMAVALSRFGTFSGLKETHSSTTDVYPNTQTLSFYQSTYTSPYIVFTPVEMLSNIPQGSSYTTLQTPTSQQKNLMDQYDSAGDIPFIYFDGKYTITGATYSPTVLQGQSETQIADALSNPNSPIAKGADGAANTMIAAICSLTNNQPTSVCSTLIQGLEKDLK